MKKVVLIIGLGAVVTVGGIFYYLRSNDGGKTNSVVSVGEESYVNPFIDFTVSKKTYPVNYTLAQAADLLIVINKKHSLPADYVPSLTQSNGVNLRMEAVEGYKQLIAGAKKEGLVFTALSSYRSYSDQEKLFNEYVKKDGQTKAETYSARPGHSEHQSGLAIDIGLPSGNCNLMICMAETKEGRWLSGNAYKYGFIIRYPSGKEAETGYQYEPWHLRYVGIDTAKAIYDSGYTLDEYFGIKAGDYAAQATTN